MSHHIENKPLSPAEESKKQEQIEQVKAELYADAGHRYHPSEQRSRRNRRYADRLIHRFSEPVVRGLLIALSRLDRPLCAHWLSEADLEEKPLEEIIQPFDLGGRRFRITSVEGNDYVVEISAGHGTAGDGGRFRIERCGDVFVIKEPLEQWVF